MPEIKIHNKSNEVIGSCEIDRVDINLECKGIAVDVNEVEEIIKQSGYYILNDNELYKEDAIWVCVPQIAEINDLTREVLRNIYHKNLVAGKDKKSVIVIIFGDGDYSFVYPNKANQSSIKNMKTENKKNDEKDEEDGETKKFNREVMVDKRGFIEF